MAPGPPRPQAAPPEPGRRARPGRGRIRGVCQGGNVTQPAPPRVVIAGGGIAGLAAAFFLRDEPVSVTVLEGSPRIGGKLAVSEVAGIPADEGAEALLARRPEGTELIRAAGLAGQLTGPGTTTAAIWSRG